MSTQLRFRPYEESDFPQVCRLWEQHAGWGNLTAEQWRSWYHDCPSGPAIVTISENDDGEVVGQQIFLPIRVLIDAHECLAMRLSAPVLHRDLRRIFTAQHPIFGMYFCGVELARRQGCRLVYSLPEHAWLPFFRWSSQAGLLNFAQAEFGCLEFQAGAFDAAVQTMASDLTASPIARFGDEYDQLWNRARTGLGIQCGVIRESRRLTYRNGAHLTVEVRRPTDGQLVGYVAVRKKDHLLTDVLAQDQELLIPVLAASLQHLAPTMREQGWSLRAMETSSLATALRAVGFQPVDFRFAFVSESLDGRLSADQIAPPRWYVTPGD